MWLRGDRDCESVDDWELKLEMFRYRHQEILCRASARKQISDSKFLNQDKTAIFLSPGNHSSGKKSVTSLCVALARASAKMAINSPCCYFLNPLVSGGKHELCPESRTQPLIQLALPAPLPLPPKRNEPWDMAGKDPPVDAFHSLGLRGSFKCSPWRYLSETTRFAWYLPSA